MTFAVRPIGLHVKRWEFVGAGAVSYTDSALLPSTAQPGDLAVWCGSVTSSGTPPAGWTLIAAGATLQAYKVCVGGETSATWAAVSGTKRAAILLFRPSGGDATLTVGATDSPPITRDMTASGTPSLIVAIGNRTSTVNTWLAALPGTWNNEINLTTAPGFYVSWRFMEPGESTGNMQLAGSAVTGARQTFGVFGIT